MIGEKPVGSWTSVETLEDQLAVLLSKLSDPLIQTIGGLIGRISEHVESSTRKGYYLGGPTVVQVIDELAEVISRAALVVDTVMQTVGDKIVEALDRKIESDLDLLEATRHKAPGLTQSKLAE
jgi:hypothetical protein